MPHVFLRWKPVDRWLRVILATNWRHQVPVGLLCPVWAEAPVPYLHQPELTGCNSVRPVTHPYVKAFPLQENLVEVLSLKIHLSWRC